MLTKMPPPHFFLYFILFSFSLSFSITLFITLFIYLFIFYVLGNTWFKHSVLGGIGYQSGIINTISNWLSNHKP
jgi:hypothetical protein